MKQIHYAVECYLTKDNLITTIEYNDRKMAERHMGSCIPNYPIVKLIKVTTVITRQQIMEINKEKDYE